MTEIRQFDTVRATVKIRREFPFEVRAEVEGLDGITGLFQVGFIFDDEADRYYGEWAMIPIGDNPVSRLGYIASGDLLDIERVSNGATA